MSHLYIRCEHRRLKRTDFSTLLYTHSTFHTSPHSSHTLPQTTRLHMGHKTIDRTFPSWGCVKRHGKPFPSALKRLAKFQNPSLRFETSQLIARRVHAAHSQLRGLKLIISHGFELTNSETSMYFNNVELVQQLIETRRG